MSIAHDLPLVSTLAVGLSLAFACGLLATKLKIPPIVGYLFAGIIIGPYTPGFNADIKIAEEFSEIGIVLLMFGVGLHFSIKELMDVRKIAIPGAIVQIVTATVLGMAFSYFLGWGLASGLIFGLALSVASTVVLLRSLEEHNILQTTDGQIAVGWLIVEDIVMVLALVLIPAFFMREAGMDAAQQGGNLWVYMGIAISKVVAFVIVMVVAGRRFLPWILGYVSRTGSRELFTLSVIAAAIGVAFAAAKLFGVSFALGAFFSGMMIKESSLNHEVAARALPLQDAFAVLFFVSVGMLFDPSILWQQPLFVAIVVGIIMFGKSIAALVIVLMFGYPLRTGLLVSSGLAQIGEFSFILVALGLSLEILPQDGRDLVLAGALISIACNPLMFEGAHFLYRFVETHPVLHRRFNMKGDKLATLKSATREELKKVVILVGYGTVGKYIRRYLQEFDFDLVIIDGNRERVTSLRELGFHAISADAGDPDVLKAAAINYAIAVIIAVPDTFEARRIIDAARKLNPQVRIIARALNDEEVEFFQDNSVDLAVSGADEIGRRVAQYISTLNVNSSKADRALREVD